MEKIMFGDKMFSAVQVINLTQAATVPEHKTEDGFEISDHIESEPVEFRIEIELLKNKNEYEKLKALYDIKEPITFVSEYGIFEKMIIQNISYDQGGNISTIRASVRLKQIQIATVQTMTISLPITAAETKYPGGNTVTKPEEKNVSDAPVKEKDKSWLDSIWDWLGGLF